MTVFFVMLIALGWIFSYIYGAPEILYGVALFSIVMNIIAYWNSASIALAMSGAKPIARQGNEYVYRMVENLCITAGLPLPKMYIIESPQINAFATGRDPKHAAIAVTRGAIEKLQNEELEGVLAHELSHVGNRDILVATVAVVLAGLIAVLADIILRMNLFRDNNRERGGNAIVLAIAVIAMVLAPIAAMLIQLAISRKREYLADASGALLTRYPEGLAFALEKIGADQQPMRAAHASTAHLFISNPFKGKEKSSWFTKLFMTHPPLEDRIRILRGMDVNR